MLTYFKHLYDKIQVSIQYQPACSQDYLDLRINQDVCNTTLRNHYPDMGTIKYTGSLIHEYSTRNTHRNTWICTGIPYKHCSNIPQLLIERHQDTNQQCKFHVKKVHTCT